MPYSATIIQIGTNERRIYADQVILRYSTTFQGANTIQASCGFRGNKINEFILFQFILELITQQFTAANRFKRCFINSELW